MEAAPRLSRIAPWAAGAIAQVIVLVLLLGPVADQHWWAGFRNYFTIDQLSYPAIAVNVASGSLTLDEPFTRTGTSHYPSLWYLILGMVGRVSRVEVYLLWQVMGLIAVMGSIAVLGWAAFRMSTRWWAPLLPAAALLTGTLSTVQGDGWYSLLGHHAVLWGPFATLYTLNAEAVAVGVSAVAMVLLLLAAGGLFFLPGLLGQIGRAHV